MRLLEQSVRRPVTVAMCIVAIVLFGLVSFQNMGLNLLPRLNYPTVAIVTPYPNADPRTVELEVTIPIEEVLVTVNGLQRVESQSYEHASVILATFDWGTNLREAIDEINSLLNVLALQLPADAERPIVSRLDPSQLPLMLIGLVGERSVPELTAFADQIIRPRLEQIPGVSQVSVLGGIRPQISVTYYEEDLIDARVTPYHILYALSTQNFAVSAGSSERELDDGRRIDTLTYVGNLLESVDELQSLYIGPTLRIEHVADVELEYTSLEGFTRVNGSPAVILRVFSQPGANSVTVAREIHEMLARFNEDPENDVEVLVVADQSEMIVESTSTLSDTLIVGGVLAFAVLILFLRDWRSLLVLGISIPLSLLITFILLYVLGYTLNIMTLGGLVIAVGMLVDNSIVVLENIFRLRAQGMELVPAAITGTREMASSITSATATTVAVFVPLIFSTSTAGHLFKELAIAVCLTLGASLLVAIFFVPALAVQLRLAPGLTAGNGNAAAALRNPPQAIGLRWETALRSVYRALLSRYIRRPLITVGIVILAGVLLVILPGALGTEFLPPMDGSQIQVRITLPTGTPIDVTSDYVAAVEEHLLSLPEVRSVAAYGGEQGAQSIFDLIQATPGNAARVVARLHPPESRTRSVFDIAAELSDFLHTLLPQGAVFRVSADRAADALGDDFAMAATVQITGPDREVLDRLTAQVAERMAAVDGFREIASSAEDRQTQIFYEVNRGVALQGNMTTQQIALFVRMARTGFTATHLLIGDQRIPVVLRPHQRDLDSLLVFSEPESLSAFRSPAPFRNLVSSITERTIPRSIVRVDRQPVVTVSAQLDGLDISESRRLVEGILNEIEMPFGYEAKLVGIHATIDEAFADLGIALLLAVLFIFLLLASQFESLRHPSIIFFAIPLATVGGFLALYAAGHYLSVPALIGLIALAGVSVNHGIVLVDTMNRLRRDGLPLEEAILSGCAIRLRPVLMTTLTTVLALCPLAFRWVSGPGADIQAPLAVAMVGGLVLATFLTLLLTPAIYRMLSKEEGVVTSQPGRHVADASL